MSVSQSPIPSTASTTFVIDSPARGQKLEHLLSSFPVDDYVKYGLQVTEQPFFVMILELDVIVQGHPSILREMVVWTFCLCQRLWLKLQLWLRGVCSLWRLEGGLHPGQRPLHLAFPLEVEGVLLKLCIITIDIIIIILPPKMEEVNTTETSVMTIATSIIVWPRTMVTISLLHMSYISTI